MPRRSDWPLLALYALGFALTHALAARWSGSGYYSLWFPAAGLRLALLWRMGARLTPAVAMVELGVDLLTGAVVLARGDWGIAILGAVRPVIAYGVVIAMIRHLAKGARGELLTRPMPLALASVLAPHAAAFAALPQAWWRPDLTEVGDWSSRILSLSAFAVGDLLGVLLVAPPLLWIADRIAGEGSGLPARPSARAALEAALVLGGGVGIGAALMALGLGLQPAPALVAVAWVGLRFGRAAAWGALLLVAAVVLPITAGAMDTALRLQLHLGLATIVMVGYLAGSFADAHARARADLERRDRLLLQAERLKTLRAMSVAVIHEISQPLSTLAIEANHLRSLTETAAAPKPGTIEAANAADIAATAALIDRKAAHLSTLVRRLRRYGGRAVDEPSPLPLGVLIDSVVALARPETTMAGVALTIAPIDPDLIVLGQEVELTQAIVNLLRNAAQACGEGGAIVLAVSARDAKATIAITNRCAAAAGAYAGMGVGTLVARAIVEAHGGALARETQPDGSICATIVLPLIGDAV